MQRPRPTCCMADCRETGCQTGSQNMGQYLRSFAELQELLRKGMEALSQAEVGSALQVYFNLGELKEVRSFVLNSFSSLVSYVHQHQARLVC